MTKGRHLRPGRVGVGAARGPGELPGPPGTTARYHGPSAPRPTPRPGRLLADQ